MKRMWYLRCSNCGAYRSGLIDILEPCRECGQVVSWKKAFVVELACSKEMEETIVFPEFKEVLEREETRQKGNNDFN